MKKERDAVAGIQKLLKAQFNLDSYVAINVQSLGDIMHITEELWSSDYYLFIDFKRPSLFSHQELALAQNLGFGSDVVALRETGTKLHEFLRYVQSNPKVFTTVKDLLHKIENLVRQKGWSPYYSRNLVVHPTLTRSGVVNYGDHTGQAVQESWKVKIENRRPDVAAVGVVCVLDSILLPSGVLQLSPDSGYLKWAGHRDFQRTLLPNSIGEVDVCATRANEPGLFLLSTLDVVPRQPILTQNGVYELNYKVFAQDFPMVKFTVIFDLQWQPPSPATWTNKSAAQVKP